MSVMLAFVSANPPIPICKLTRASSLFKGITEHTATKVPGRNTMVMMDIDFIALLSLFAATASSRESYAKSLFTRLFCRAM